MMFLFTGLKFTSNRLLRLWYLWVIASSITEVYFTDLNQELEESLEKCNHKISRFTYTLDDWHLSEREKN